MSQNIFQVINETHLDEILLQHMRDLVIIMLSSKTCPPCKIIKPKFIELSKSHKDVFFVYVDRSNYNGTTNKYFAEYEFTPTFLFYFGNNRVAFIEGSHEESLIKILMILKQKINEKRQEIQQKEKIIENQIQNLQNQPLDIQNNIAIQELNPINEVNNANAHTELTQRKINGLNKLRELVQKGIKLTSSYNLDSDIDDINFEIRFQTDPQFKQYILTHKQQSIAQQTNELTQQNGNFTSPAVRTTQSTQSSTAELQPIALRKQEQVKQIQELNMLNQKMQMESLQKLQLLKKIKTVKEQQELNNSDPK